VLDRVSLSKVCGSCGNRSSWDKESDEYKLWYESHKETCAKNYNGSSPSVETAAAVIIWNQSIAKHNLRYRYMVCDGDSKAFHAVEHAYGDNHKYLTVLDTSPSACFEQLRQSGNQPGEN
jgi:hypothetical protein